MGRFIFHTKTGTQGGSVLYVCTKFEADSSFCSNVIRRSQNFEIGHAHLGIVLYSIRRPGPSSSSVPNLKQLLNLFKNY